MRTDKGAVTNSSGGRLGQQGPEEPDDGAEEEQGDCPLHRGQQSKLHLRGTLGVRVFRFYMMCLRCGTSLCRGPRECCGGGRPRGASSGP